MPMHAPMVARLVRLAVLLSWSTTAMASDPCLRVVVHPSRATRLSVAEVRAIFLKQQLLWSDGEPIIPVNRQAGSRVREAFSQAVFGQSSRRLAAYWNRRYFEAGEFPPATLASQEAVLRFVASNANAIGYVAGSPPDDTVAAVGALDGCERGSGADADEDGGWDEGRTRRRLRSTSD